MARPTTSPGKAGPTAAAWSRRSAWRQSWSRQRSEFLRHRRMGCPQMAARQRTVRTVALAATLLLVAIIMAVRLRAAYQLGEIRRRVQHADHFVYYDERFHFRFEHDP